jgi:hypothetical protein
MILSCLSQLSEITADGVCCTVMADVADHITVNLHSSLRAGNPDQLIKMYFEHMHAQDFDSAHFSWWKRLVYSRWLACLSFHPTASLISNG